MSIRLKIDRSIFSKYKIFITIGLTILILTSLRIAWIFFFSMSDGPDAVGGKLDLSNWDFQQNGTITLDGEWEFYPHTLLMNDDQLKENKHFLHVPGSWNNLISKDGEASFGYGSYRLRVLVDPKVDTNYSIRVPSVRSSSELYVNGQLLAKSGQPAKNQADYLAENIPYTATFSTGELKEIEIVMHVANYKDTRDSGIIRSMKFGTERAIMHETKLSILMQVIVSIAFSIHALYAIILYFMGRKDKRFLYFSIIVISIVMNIILSNDEKILLEIIPVPYELSFKISNLTIVVMSFFLVKLLQEHFSTLFRTKIIPIYTILCLVDSLMIVFLPVEKIFTFSILYIFITVFAILSAVFILVVHFKKVKEFLFITIASLAVMNDFVWSLIIRETGIKTLYYPIDIIIAIVAFSMIWIKRYSQNYQKSLDLTKELQRINQKKDQFLANTSHELRNPLHGIINITEAVIEEEQATLTEKNKQNLTDVVLVGKRMSYMLNDLLEVVRLKESNITLQQSAVNIHKTAASIINMLQYLTNGKQIVIENRIPTNFPFVQADENRLIQILFNLLHNAVKFTHEGIVYISAKEKDGQAFISVHDTGIGMNEEMTARVFESYEQATVSETSIEGGFGLGLSVSQQLVKLHDSELTVQSTLGKGSTFSFALKFADVAVEQAESHPTDMHSLCTEKNVHTEQVEPLSFLTEKTNKFRPRILAVDDDPFNLAVLKKILPAKEYDVVTVTSGKEALDFIHTERWHLLITDVMMPDMSGYELTQLVRERFSLLDLPIILLTALSSSKEIEHGFLAGANDFVTKPIDATVLRSRVKALTDLQLSMTERLRMESALLQAQMQPHFIFNTLNSIAALSQIDTERMLDLLEAFSNYLRGSFDFHNIESLVPIEYELDLVRSYLYIEKERFPEKLTTHIEMDDELQLFIPPLTIQPLVENAVKHGILKKRGGGTVTVKVTEHDSYYQISIEDDGVGIEKETVEHLRASNFEASKGIGLVNTHQRLMKQFGSGLEIMSTRGEGTVVSFIIKK